MDSLKEQAKKTAAEKATVYLADDMVLGIGTGTTVKWFIEALAQKCREGYKCRCIPTSKATETLARSLGIPLVQLNDVSSIDLTVDGADEIDPQLNLIKGGGGALLQEKMVAAASNKLVIIADDAKAVNQLGKFPLPVEVIPFGWKQVQQRIAREYYVSSALRMSGDSPLTTDHGHYILDCQFEQIADPASLALQLNIIPGVVECGLFIHMASLALIADSKGNVRELGDTSSSE